MKIDNLKENWVINFLISESVAHELVDDVELEPVRTNMRHVVQLWVNVDFTLERKCSCEFNILCFDSKTERQFKWIGRRYINPAMNHTT